MTDDRIRQLHRQLLSELKPPAPPPELRGRAFLEGIYEHAAAAEEVALRPVLDASVTPLTAPADACWREVDEPADMSDRVAAALPDGPAPGWLWSRVRADMRAQRATVIASRRKSALVRYAAAAAVLIVSSIGAFFLVDDGTKEPTSFVWVREPMDAASDLLMGRRTD